MIGELKSQIFEDYDALLDDPSLTNMNIMEVSVVDMGSLTGSSPSKKNPDGTSDPNDPNAALNSADDAVLKKRAYIRAASFCVNALPSTIRHEIITRFCLRLLEEYKKLFQPNMGGPGNNFDGEMNFSNITY